VLEGFLFKKRERSRQENRPRSGTEASPTGRKKRGPRYQPADSELYQKKGSGNFELPKGGPPQSYLSEEKKGRTKKGARQKKEEGRLAEGKKIERGRLSTM